ncbi:hypothetical protein A9Q84_15815 [Halobacteriovorax marinus]|uniref:histidine kinase n=1 Tax=Halobacteriovorax marinus TaxID=97084 RepID=A0A1Y5F4A7_9BACT|nr:hypothetical protein A9Q84_15815 [Halobacteriovorax marinus]
MESLFNFFSESDFMPHGHCYLWKPSLVWLHVISDFLLFLSFEIILVILMVIVMKSRKKIPFDWAITVIASLFLFCGFTHLMEVWNLWHSNYWLGGVLKALTATASVLSVAVIIPIIPAILKLPTPTELMEINKKLKEALEQKERLQKSLISQEKLASLGTVAAGIAHEIKNPINLMINSADYIKDFMEGDLLIHKDILLKEIQLDKKKDFEEDLDEAIHGCSIITNNGKRADAIIKNMLAQTRSGKVTFKLCNLKDLVTEYLNLSFHSARVKYVMDVKTDLTLVNIGEMDLIAVDIGRALTNIFDNSFYALKKKKNDLGEHFKPKLKVELTLKDQTHACLKIHDNGSGIPDDIFDRVLEPFYTTKRAGEGAGLGLSMVNDIIKSHEGEFLFDSKIHDFTEVTILLPLKMKGRNS